MLETFSSQLVEFLCLQYMRVMHLTADFGVVLAMTEQHHAVFYSKVQRTSRRTVCRVLQGV